MENCLLWEECQAGAGAEREEEGAAETAWDELTTAPIPHPPAPLRGEEVEKIRSEAEPGKKGGVGGKVVLISLSRSDLIGTK